MPKLRTGTPADYEQVMERCLISFCDHTPDHLPFEVLYPDTIRPDQKSMQQWLLIEEEKQIAAGLQLVPRPLILRGVGRIPMTGLGNVFCYPPFRGRGFMSTLLNTAIPVLSQQGVAVCLLGGDRLRYGRFGWENAGTVRRLRLSAGMLRDQKIERLPPNLFSRWNGDETTLGRMFEAYSKLETRCVRTREEFAAVLRRPGQAVWTYSGQEGFAWASTRGQRVLEYAGDADALERILIFLLQRRGLDVELPPTEAANDIDERLLNFAAGFSVQCTGMVRIINLRRVFEAWNALVQQRLRGWNGAIAFEAPDENMRVTLRGDGTGVAIVEADAPEVVSLPLRDLTRLIFGPFPPAGAFLNSEVVRRLFPLPLFWPPLAHV